MMEVLYLWNVATKFQERLCKYVWGEVCMGGGYLPHIINSSSEDLHWPRSVPVTALKTTVAADLVANARLA
jgi:hypothetical protein